MLPSIIIINWTNVSKVTVHGVDLFPPPQTWVPPNCFLEVDDVSKPWSWTQKFDLIHLRWLFGSFTDEGWKELYQSAYKSLKPGGWIEQVESSVILQAGDGSIPPSSAISRWGPLFIACGQKSGRRLDIEETMRRDIEAAGFTNVHEKYIKIPIGTWRECLPYQSLYLGANKASQAPCDERSRPAAAQRGP